MENPSAAGDAAAGPGGPVRFRIEREHPVAGTDAGWVYAWLADGRVQYIGATWLHPAVRADAHLHLATDDPRSLALRERVARGVAFEVVALPVPSGLDRAELKADLVAACHAAGMLAFDFIGTRPSSVRHRQPTDAGWLAEALQALGVPTSEPSVRVHLLQHRGLLAPDLVAPLQDAARAAALAAASDLGLDDVDLVLCDYPGLAIEELGVGGYSPGAHLVFVALDPSRPGFARWREHLPSTVRHELHHARRHVGAGYGPTLLDSLVGEGAATLYEIETGTRPAYSEVPVDLEAMWQQALPLLERTDQHPRWFFGMGDLPRWAGYTLGTELARRHGVRAGLTAAQLAEVPAAAFPASW